MDGIPELGGDIVGLSHGELAAWLAREGIAPYRAAQILRWVHQRRAPAFDVMTDLSTAIRSRLAARFTIGRLPVTQIRISRDGSRKFLFTLHDGVRVESVLMPGDGHTTVCISSQAGCAQGCRFCLTAAEGLVRHLNAAEIVAQVRDAVTYAERQALPAPSHVVLMGMGEPLANYANVIRALGIITDREAGLGFSTRRVTLSTAGIVPRLADLARDSAVNLAVSLNAVDDATRNRLMPVNRRYPLDRLLAACRAYPLARRRRITFEYILLRDVNDRPREARRLAELLRPIPAKVNLIPFNPFAGSPFDRPDPCTVTRFQQILQERHLTAIVRHSKGQDIGAACGQLRAARTGREAETAPGAPE